MESFTNVVNTRKSPKGITQFHNVSSLKLKVYFSIPIPPFYFTKFPISTFVITFCAEFHEISPQSFSEPLYTVAA